MGALGMGVGALCADAVHGALGVGHGAWALWGWMMMMMAWGDGDEVMRSYSQPPSPHGMMFWVNDEDDGLGVDDGVGVDDGLGLGMDGGG
jgi:hypothetical protein